MTRISDDIRVEVAHDRTVFVWDTDTGASLTLYPSESEGLRDVLLDVFPVASKAASEPPYHWLGADA